MSAVFDFIGDVFEAVGDVVESVAKAVVNTVKAAVKDPITTLAKVAAYATGNVWAIPLIDGASTLAKGGDIGDALKSAAISYGTQQIQIKVGSPVGKAAGQFVAAQGAGAATQQLVTNIVTRAAGNAGVALITKQDPVKAFVAGGVSAASSAVLGQIPNFEKQPAWVQNTVATSVGALVAGQQGFDEAAASVLVATSGIVSNALKLYDPDGTKMTAAQRSVAADAIFKTTSAALAGRSGTEALTQSLTNAAAGALGEFAKDSIKTATEGMAESYARINGYGSQLDDIANRSQSAVTRYNDVNGSLTAAINEQNRLYAAQEAARNAYNSSGSDADYNAATAAVNAYNDYVSALNKSYTEYYKPTLDSLSSETQRYQDEYNRITGVASSEQDGLKAKIDALTSSLNPIYANSNRAFAEGLMPGFDAAAYRALNPDLPKDSDPYLHYITKGQFEGLKGTKQQLTESNAIMESILGNSNVGDDALQAYIDSGYVSKNFVENYSKKKFDDLMNQLDLRVTNESEATQFFKDVYGREPMNEQDMAKVQSFTNMAEDAAKRTVYATKQLEDDMAEFVYDGSGAKSQQQARDEARANGYNTYSFDGKQFTIAPQEEINQRVELGKQILAQQGKNLTNATTEDIDRAMELANRVPQDRLKGASVQDVLNGNYSGWRDGKYYEYAGDKLRGVYAIDPETGNFTIERLEISGAGPSVVASEPKSLQELAETDPTGYVDLAKKLDDKAKNDLGDFFTNSLRSAMLMAESSGNKELASNIRQTFSVLTQGLGEQTESLAKFYASVTGGSYDTSVIRAAKALQEWGAANQSASTADQEKAIKDAVSGTDGTFNKIKAFVGAAADNPGGFMTMLAKEGVQQVLPLWAAKGAVAFGKMAAYGANAALNGMESWGSSSGDIYDYAIRSGKNENEAREMALKAGFQSAAITMATTGVTDIPMVKKFLGDGIAASFQDIGKATAASTMGEYVEELFQNANNQRIATGKIDWDQATTAATIASGVAAGTTGSIMTGLSIRDNATVAKDFNGNDVSLADFIAGTRPVDMKTLNMNTVVGNSADGDSITLGGVAAMQMSSGLSYDTYRTGLPSVISNENYVLGKDALGNDVTLSSLLSQTTDNTGFDTLYNNLLNTSQQERTDAQTDFLNTVLSNLGYKPTQDEINTLIQETPGGTPALTSLAQQYAKEHTVTEDDARKYIKEAYEAAGFTEYEPTQQQIESFIQSGASVNHPSVISNIGNYVNENSVTQDEARQMLSDLGYTPTEEEIKQFVDTVNQQSQLDAINKYVDPRMVTFDEAKSTLERLGYKPSDEEINQFMGQKNDAAYQAAQEAGISEYVDPRLVDEQEVRDAYLALGLKKPTVSDVQKLIGQYDELELADRSKANLQDARYNSLFEQFEALQAAQMNPPPAPGPTAAEQEEANRQANIRNLASQAQTQTQMLSAQLPMAFKSLQETTKPIFAGEIQDFDLNSPLDVGFFEVRKEAQDGQKQQQATKIAAGGYIDDLLAGDMTADDLLNLLR